MQCSAVVRERVFGMRFGVFATCPLHSLHDSRTARSDRKRASDYVIFTTAENMKRLIGNAQCPSIYRTICERKLIQDFFSPKNQKIKPICYETLWEPLKITRERKWKTRNQKNQFFRYCFIVGILDWIFFTVLFLVPRVHCSLGRNFAHDLEGHSCVFIIFVFFFLISCSLTYLTIVLTLCWIQWWLCLCKT